MYDRRADRPVGDPMSWEDARVAALMPTVKPGTVNVYRGRRNGLLSDLVAVKSVHDDAALHWYQQSGYILWGE